MHGSAWVGRHWQRWPGIDLVRKFFFKISHTSGPLAWMVWGPQNAKYTPPKVLKALGQAITTTIGPWVASSRLVGKEVHMYVDAA